MFCEKCGAMITDGERFCGNCGAPVDLSQHAAPQQQNTPQETVMQNNTQPYGAQPYVLQQYGDQQYTGQPYGDQQYAGQQYGGQQFSYQPEAPKKKGLGKKGLIGIIAAAVVLVVGGFLAFALATGLFLPPAAKLHRIEKKALHSAISTYDDNIGKTASQDKGAVSIDIEAGEYLKTFASSQGVDLSWLNNLTLDYAVDTSSNVPGAQAKFSLNNVELAAFKVFVDTNANQILMGADGLSDCYAAMDMDDLGYGYSNLSEMMAASGDSEEGLKLVEKYFGLAVDTIDKVETSKGSITANGVTQNCTVYTTQFTDRMAVNMGKKVLTTARDDKELKKYLEKNYPLLTSYIAAGRSGDMQTFDEFYANFITEIDEGLDSLDQSEMNIKDEVLFTMEEYVSGSKIIGIKITTNYGQSMFFGVAENGKNFGIEMTALGQTYLTGSGTKNGSRVSGDLHVFDDGTALADIKLTDFDAKKCEGTMEISLSTEVWDELVSSSSTASILSNASMKIDFESNKTVIDILFMGQSAVKATIKEGKKETLKPDSSMPTVDVDEWAQTLDTSVLVERLRNAGVPEMYLSSLNSAARYLD